MASSANESDDGISDIESLETTLEKELAGGMNFTQDDEFLNLLCDNDKLARKLDYTLGNEEEVGGSPSRTKAEMDYPEDDEQGIGVEFTIHNPMTKWSLMKPTEKEIYESPQQLKFALTNYAVANGYPLRFTKCDSSRIQAKCGKAKDGKTCPFFLWASWMGSERSFQIKKIVGKHICVRSYDFGGLVNPDWIAKHYVKFIAKPNMKTMELKYDIEKKFFCKVSKGQCHRAKKRIETLIEGKITDHYNRLWDYAHEIRRSNPGSTVQLGVHVNPDGNYFHRFYVCFKALKDGWNRGCRRIFGLDGCFLKGKVKGELLSAVGRDENNQIYPIAWAVVDIENKDNWKWFIGLLSEDLGLNEGMGLSIMSDQHKGLIEAVKEVLPHAEHRQCARHIYANLRKTYSGKEIQKLFWLAVKSTTEVQFMEHIKAIKAISVGAYEHLMAREPKSWCMAFFALGKACEAVENGMSESFNSVIEKARKKPIITMLEEIRLYMMKRICTMSKCNTQNISQNI